MKIRRTNPLGQPVNRVTISLPPELFAWGEKERGRQRLTRSEFVTGILRQHHDEMEHARRIARYASAYAKLPTSPEEEALTKASTDLLFGEAGEA